jgi:hypothetical protein
MVSTRLSLPELWFTAAMLLAVAGMSIALGFTISLPSGNAAAFIGIHYLYPLLGVGLWATLAAFGLRQVIGRTMLIALPCYALVLLCHFNLKLWAPHINPMLWDELYWRTDTFLRPLVELCFMLRGALAVIVPLDSNFYMSAFITMFYGSFCIHALRGEHQFRTLFLAALLFQGLGAIAYLMMPAVGPFLYEQGVEPVQTATQQAMLAAREANLAGGAGWIAAHGGSHITMGLAAMPSLHTGGAFLFLLFAWRYARVLVPVYAPLFAFISVDAVASRWHYVIDLPAGIALALGCAWAAERLNPRGADDTVRQRASADLHAGLLARLRPGRAGNPSST